MHPSSPGRRGRLSYSLSYTLPNLLASERTTGANAQQARGSYAIAVEKEGSGTRRYNGLEPRLEHLLLDKRYEYAAGLLGADAEPLRY